MTQALLDVFAERQRQIDAEGWAPEHDDTHTDGELSAAASTYAWGACVQVAGHELPDTPPNVWPFETAWWKPAEEPRRNLIKAAALILAEIERLDRASDATPAIARLVEWRPIDEAEKYDGEFLLHGPSLIDMDFNPTGIVEGYWQDDEGWIGAVWCGCHDCWKETVIEPTHFAKKPAVPDGLGGLHARQERHYLPRIATRRRRAGAQPRRTPRLPRAARGREARQRRRGRPEHADGEDAMSDLKRCSRHAGEDCENCGGSGWRKRCDRRQCIEHGCDGGIHCFVPISSVPTLVNDAMKRLGFSSLREANVARQSEWGGYSETDTAFKALEVSGEAGELAEAVKKLLRAERGIQGSTATLEKVADEAGDVVIALDLLCEHLGIDLAEAVAEKFNRTSVKYGLQTRLSGEEPL